MGIRVNINNNKKKGEGMIGWILGGLILAAAIWIVYRTITHIEKGESSCDCGHCGQSCSLKK